MILLLDFHVGDEDGPYYISTVHREGFITIPLSHILVTNNTPRNYPRPILQSRDILTLLDRYNITDILEIHDYYDFLTDQEVLSLQADINQQEQLLPNYNDQLALITFLPYNVAPQKYVLPYSSEILQIILANRDLFSRYGEGDDQVQRSKRNLITLLSPYKITASYDTIFKNLNIDYYDVIKSDEIPPIF